MRKCSYIGLTSCLIFWLSGCAALTNPVANGIPVRLLSPDLLAESKADLQRLPLTVLRQPPPDAYRLDSGDVLGIWIEGVLGEKGQVPPIQQSDFDRTEPSLGFPIPVRSDGTISLPFVPTLNVRGLSLVEVERTLVKAYTQDQEILKAGRERIIVTLQHRRKYHVLVIRQDSGAADGSAGQQIGVHSSGFTSGTGESGRGRRGAGFAIDLPAYENDVLNALAKTGGFPGSDAVNEIIIEKGASTSNDPTNVSKGKKTIRIPLRYHQGDQPTVRPEDVILLDGDVIYIDARDTDTFYTAGLLPPGQYVLPRDVDLDIIEAISRVNGILNSGGTSAINLSGTVGSTGIGIPSPSLVTVLRRTSDGGQVPIRVDLDRALRDPRERILIQAKDVIMLQEHPQDAITRYFSNAFNLSVMYRLIDSSRATASSSLSVP